MESGTKDNNIIGAISAVSIAVPLLVGVLIFVPWRLEIGGVAKSLPGFNALLNSLTVAALLGAFVAIRKGHVLLHKKLMISALILGALFLLSYVAYHASVESVIYGDMDHDGVLSSSELEEAGAMRGVYLFVLLSHIGLSIVVVPFVLLAFYRAAANQPEKHKAIVKWAFPIWLYVSVTGVLVYLLIKPYYH